MNASYGKLKDGTWGIRVEGGSVGVGEEVTVTKRDGTTKIAEVRLVLAVEDAPAWCPCCQADSPIADEGGEEILCDQCAAGCDCGRPA